MVFGDLHQHFDHQTLQDHLAPNTSSDSLFKTALTDSSRSVAAGLIRIAPEAQGTEAFLESRNMLLSDKARADSIPGLEILANDVRCKHAATVGRIDEEQLFYLMSRGVDRDTAESLIVAGFFAPVIDRVPMEWLRNKLTATLARRLELAHEHSRDPAGAARG
jgi:Fe-S cluster assembly protein SufD